MKVSKFLKSKVDDILVKIDEVEKELIKKKKISEQEKKINKTKK